MASILSSAQRSDPDVYVHRAFWDRRTCAALRLAMDGGDHAPAEIYDEAFVVDRSVRDTADVEVDAPTLAQVETALAAVRPRVGRHFNLSLAASEGAGFLRYGVGGRYRAHQDALPPGDGVSPRKVSVVVFLTGAPWVSAPTRSLSACDGGALRIYGWDRHLDILPAPGMLVAFPATSIHEVLPVTRGVRDVVVDWFY